MLLCFQLRKELEDINKKLMATQRELTEAITRVEKAKATLSKMPTLNIYDVMQGGQCLIVARTRSSPAPEQFNASPVACPTLPDLDEGGVRLLFAERPIIFAAEFEMPRFF